MKRVKKSQKIYKPEFVRMAEAHCRLGATDADLANLFGVTTECIRLWQHKHSDFAAAIRYGKAEVFDPKVERALAERALGYKVDIVEKKVVVVDGDVRVKSYRLRKHYPPDVTACIFWLKNRNPKQWRDVQDHNVNVNNRLDKLSTDELLAEIRREAVELGILPEEVRKMIEINPKGRKH